MENLVIPDHIFSSVVILSIGLVDFGFSIYHRIHTDESGPGSIGYAAHIGGGAAGILVGINVLRNYIHKVSTYIFSLVKMTISLP